MFIPHRRIAMFLMTWLTMMAFTATLYMIEQEPPPALAQVRANVGIAEAPATSLPLTLSQTLSDSHSLEAYRSAAQMAIVNSRLGEQRARVDTLSAGECQERQLVNNQLIQPILRATRTSSSAQTEQGEKASTMPSRPAITCTVTTTADSDEGSLRHCLQNAVQNDTINFDPVLFPPTSPATITLSSPLPKIVADGLMIDARNAGVILNGRQLSDGSGLVVDGADGVTIQGLQILRFPIDGIEISGGATNSTIGGRTEESRNVISGNGEAGVTLRGNGTSNNQIEGNYIGTDATGTQALPNIWGVTIIDAQNNIVGSQIVGGGNLISGNQFGVQLQDSKASGNRVIGNYIGTDLTGQTPLSNGLGVVIVDGPRDNQVGGASELERNIISGNTTSNISIEKASENRVFGNYIGTDLTGSHVFTTTFGVLIGFGSQNNQIGGANEGERNLISGHDAGVQIQNSNTSGNRVLGNYIGTDSTGTVRLGNYRGVFIIFAQNNLIGGAKEGEGNLISGNTIAVDIGCAGTSGNQLLGNYIGTDFTGSNRLGGVGNRIGIIIQNSASQNQVGGEEAGARNLISGNALHGISISGSETNGNHVLGNYVGTNISGTAPLSNAVGIEMYDGANNNVIGGASRNLISGNNIGISMLYAAKENQVEGNYIGTNLTGSASLGNEVGVVIDLGAHDNVVGGETENARNVISGNTGNGVTIGGYRQSGAKNNQVLGNYIGTDRTGTKPLGNFFSGVLIVTDTSNSLVENNLISANALGILIAGEGTSENQVRGNYIGTDLTGAAPLGNMLEGIALILNASSNTIGISNTIAYNGVAGIWVDWETTSGNTITRNIIRDNNGPPISISKLIPLSAPALERYSESDHMLSGRACAGCRVEVFANPTEEPAGSTFLLEVTADAEGTFTAMISVPPDFPYLSATMTDLDGTTFQFSDSLCTTCAIDESFTLYLPTVLR